MPDVNPIPDSFDLIDNHLSEFFDEEEVLVLHEKESEVVHTDIYIIKPAKDRPYHILLSSGLSALPMCIPEDQSDPLYAEVMMLLPSTWNILYEHFDDENNYWPFRVLKQLSKYPHLNNTWLGWGHTVTLDLSHPVNHRFTSVMLLDSITLSDEFTIIAAVENRFVNVYAVIPLYEEEREFAIANGTGKLMEKFEAFGIDEVVDVNRPNTCEATIY